MVTGVELVTGFVVTVKLALLLPPGTVTVAGTLATAVLLLPSDTTAPPLGAKPLNTTVPWELPPPATLLGTTVTDETLKTVIVLVAGVRSEDPRESVTVKVTVKLPGLLNCFAPGF